MISDRSRTYAVATASSSTELVSAYLLSTGIVPAAGIALFGLVFIQRLGANTSGCGLLWFSSALVIYCADRFYQNREDRFNMTLLYRYHRQCRRLQGCVCVCAALLFVWSISRHSQQGIVCLVCAGLVICLFYSRPIPFTRLRIKDVAYVKSLFPAAAIATAWFALPAIQSSGVSTTPYPAIALIWVLSILLVNIILCDVRDMHGDASIGVRTIAVCLGRQKTMVIIRALLTCAWCCVWLSAQHWSLFVMMFATTVYVTFLFGSYDRWGGQSWFHDYALDGMLFVPLLVELASRYA